MEYTPPYFGVISHIVTLAFAKHETSVTYGFFPWSSTLMLATKGLWDGSVTINAEKTTSDRANFRKLAAGRIDLFPMEPAVSMEMLQELKLENKITFHSTALQSEYLYLILSRRVPESEQYLKKFNEGLSKLRESGRLEELIDSSLPDFPVRYLVVEDKDSQCGE